MQLTAQIGPFFRNCCFRAQATLRESAISAPYKYRRILQAIFDQPRQIKPKMGTDFVYRTEFLTEDMCSGVILAQ
ncbi:Hypothetical protein BIBO2_0628 [Brucella sp. BO2]|nr:Hypothetical protein BIBO2_0628 [Brucella sp. BO2]